MKFFYCVRAATKENVALPNVDNLLRPTAEYINAKNAYLDSLRIRDTDHEQSSDADSDMRSESGVSSSAVVVAAAAAAPPAITDGATTRAVNGNASSGNKREIEISSTTSRTKTVTVPSVVAAVSTQRPITSSAVTTASAPVPHTSTATSNGKETSCSVSQTQPSAARAEETPDRTLTSRPAAPSNEAVQRLSATQSQNNSPRNATDQQTKTNGNGRFCECIFNVVTS